MNYKKIIKSRSIRLKILKILSFIPDNIMLKIQYRIKTGHKLDLKNPKRFTEKLQWYKLNYKNKKMIECVDKYEARNYVRSKDLGYILLECYGIYGRVDEINWRRLPKQFVMKDTLGGGGISVVIVKDKSKIDIEKLKEVALKWIKVDSHRKDAGREWPYYSGKNHRILFEEYINPESDSIGLIDYKFFCFNGKVEFLYVMGNRKIGDKVSVSIYDRNFNKLDVKRVGDNLFENVKKPENYDEMLIVAEKLSKDFPHVRVDLYNENGNIKFGEMTFYNASGYMIYEPDDFDYIVGNLFTLERTEVV